jgi:hypothetical protein
MNAGDLSNIVVFVCNVDKTEVKASLYCKHYQAQLSERYFCFSFPISYLKMKLCMISVLRHVVME